MDRFPQLFLIRKKLRQLLDITPQTWYNEYEKRGRKTPQTRKAFIMKKTTLETIRTALTNLGYTDETVLAELDAELNKGAAEKTARAAEYESIHDLIMETLSDTPITCGELWESIEGSVPEGITKGKVQYALTHLWQDEIVKIAGKPNTYRRA
jgi:hypothetical protein